MELVGNESFSDLEKSLRISCSSKFLLSGNAIFHWKTSGRICFSTLANRATPELEVPFLHSFVSVGFVCFPLRGPSPSTGDSAAMEQAALLEALKVRLDGVWAA